MHIPDGYLSPSTCAGLYLVSAPFWYSALKRVQKTVQTNTIPLISLFAAFSFVIMMFNLPLPGGTTGHAIGVGIATVVLGPWISMLSISVALLIQALFFGDGGITTYGANSFNMAIVGSFSAAAVYAVVSRHAPVTSARRAFAAGLAGYAAINISALCAAVEFGIQPLFFRDAAGAPLYAPYPLAVSVPAMMLGHLTFAGAAEAIISAGVTRYLQTTNAGMLGGFLGQSGTAHAPALTKPPRRLWLALVAIVMLTPLGVLAVGQAWGEWSVDDFLKPDTRQRIAAVSRGALPIATAPSGLQRLSGVWNAPLPGYSPSFISNASFGYLLSAIAGVILILFISGLATRLLLRSKGRQKSFIEKTVNDLLSLMQDALFAETLARSKGLLQSMDARVKLVGLGSLLITAILVKRLPVLCGLLALAVLLAVLSRVPIRILVTRIWLAVFAFTGVIALPAVFLTTGAIVYRLPWLMWPITSQGLASAAFLLLRAETASTFALLLVLCTLWNHLLRSLRFFRLPAVVVLIVEMSYRYIFLLLQTTQNMFESRQTRIVGILTPAHQRHFIAATAGVLLDKTLQLSREVLAAMQARGFCGDVVLLEDLQVTTAGWLQLTVFMVLAALTIWLGR